MTPMQEAAIQNINQGASAFGLDAPSDPMAGMPQAQEFAGGVRGYSSAPLFEHLCSSCSRTGQASLKQSIGNSLTQSRGKCSSHWCR
jgi:hypothetical protein